MKNRIWSVLVLCAVLVAPLSLTAQEKGGKRDAATTLVTQLLKSLEKAELTPDQTTKIKDAYTKVASDVSAKRTAGGITAEILKKRADAFKSAKETGKKGKEQQEAVTAAMGLNAEQTKLWTETEAVLAKARVEIGKMLTPEQIAKLPEQAQNSLKEKAAGKKGKKKQ
jgi:hypothetical protein